MLWFRFRFRSRFRCVYRHMYVYVCLCGYMRVYIYVCGCTYVCMHMVRMCDVYLCAYKCVCEYVGISERGDPRTGYLVPGRVAGRAWEVARAVVSSSPSSPSASSAHSFRAHLGLLQMPVAAVWRDTGGWGATLENALIKGGD